MSGQSELPGIWKKQELLGTQPEPVQSKTLRKGMGVCAHFDFVINAYIGCLNACTYCYAASFVPDETRRDNWGTWLKYKSNAPSEIKGAMQSLAGKKVLMSSSTDPYQTAEGKLGLTRRILQILSAGGRHAAQPHLHLITRTPLILRDLELLQTFGKLNVTLSIPTDDEDVRRTLEPHASPLESRWKTLETLKAHGIPIAVNLCPLIRLNDPAGMARRLLALNPTHIFTDAPHNRDANGGFIGTTPPNGWAALESIGWEPDESILANCALQHALRTQGKPEEPAFPTKNYVKT